MPERAPTTSTEPRGSVLPFIPRQRTVTGRAEPSEQPERAEPSEQPERSGPPAPGRSGPRADRSPWRSLRHRDMRWWSAANLVSNTGTWMQMTVQNLLVLQLTGSAAMTGLSVALQAVPGLLVGLAGGAAVDRWPRKLTAAAGQVALGVLAFTTAALVAFGVLSVPLLLVLAMLTGLVATVEGPACALLGNDLVPEADVPSAIAVGSVVHSVGRLVGVALTGVLISAFGTASAYLANGVSFLAVAVVIPFLRPLPVTPVAPVARGGAAATYTVREGLAFFLGRRRLVALAGITALSCLLGRNYGLTLAALVTGPLHGSAGAYGAVSTVLAVGGTVGAVLAGRLRRPSVRLVAGLVALGALLQTAVAGSPSLLVLAVLVAPMALLEALGDTAVTTVLQTDPPDRMRGRVLGAWRSISTVWGLAGPPFLGLLIQTLGVRTALSAGGLLVAAPLCAALLVGRRSSGRVRAAAVPV